MSSLVRFIMPLLGLLLWRFALVLLLAVAGRYARRLWRWFWS